MRAGGEISEIFLLVKISGYNLVSSLWIVDTHTIVYMVSVSIVITPEKHAPSIKYQTGNMHN